MLMILNKHSIQERVPVITMHLALSWREVSSKNLPATSRPFATGRKDFLKI